MERDSGLTLAARSAVAAAALLLAGIAVPATAQQSGLFLFAPNQTGNSVSVYTTNSDGTLSSTATLSGFGVQPRAAAVSGDQAFTYVTNSSSDNVRVINTATGAVVQTIAAGTTPVGITLNPAGTMAYVANNSVAANSVSVYSVNSSSGQLTAVTTISTGANSAPRSVAVTPDGSTLYVANQGNSGSNGSISVINTSTNAVTATINTGGQPLGIAINPAGTTAYVTDASNQTVRVVNLSTNTVTATVGTAGTPDGVAVSKTGNFFYVANTTNGTIQIFNAGTNSAIGTVSGGTVARGLVISPDGTTLYGTDSVGNNIREYSINASTGLLTLLGTVASGSSPNYPGMCGNGSGMLGSGGTFRAGNAASLGCFGGQATFSGGTLLVTTANLAISTPMTLNAQGGTVDTNGNSATISGTIGGPGGLTKAGNGTLILTANNTYSGGTTVTGGLINFAALNNFGTGAITLNGGGLQWATGNTTDISPMLAPLGAGGGTFDTNGNNVTLASVISGAGALTKQGNGVLTLTANNTYSGGTTVTGGLINFNSASNFGTGMVTLNGGGLQWAAGSTADISSRLAPLGAGGGTFDTNGNTITFATGLTGTGGLAKQGLGTLNLTGTNTYTGGTAVLAGTLAVNGSIAGNVAVGSAGTLGGNGTIGGNVFNAGTLAPGNSIGLLTVNGSYAQMAGSTYQVEVNAAGQGDRLNVGGAAAIQGGTVQVLAAAGSYANSTTYTIVHATGGVAGTYAGVTSNFAFLTPTLSYDANDVFLTLALQQNAFTSFGGITPNQQAVGTALNQSFANASGDFATVIGALAGLSTAQGPVALDAISGQPYADFGTMNTNNSMMFMNAIGQQMAGFHGGQPAGQRLALAQACEIEACDAVGPLSAWVSALGGLGSVLGDGNASTLTYNFGGAAAGVDYRFDPRFLLGIGTGYTHGTQWVNSFLGQGWSDSVSVAAYGSFTQSGFYVDALAGYAYFNNQLQRQIVIPGLQQRTATGSTGANQFLGQAEGGYKIDIYAPAAASITPFGRFQISSVTQNAFSESGAQSLSLNVAQQTTNSLRTTIGADLGSSIGLGNEKKLDVAVRLGWQHELADTGRPITAAFAGAPGNSFTVFGATPARDAAVVGFQAVTNIAQATQVYLRYDGGVGGATDNHSLNVGLRMSW
jgi:outer membrane autotransporter protein